MSNKMIYKCEVCNQDYCAECTEGVLEWTKYCSRQCEREAEEEEERAKEERANPKPDR